MHPKQQHIIDVYGKEPSTFDEIAEACIAVISYHSRVPVVGFVWDIKYERKVSNSHDAPLSGQTNWSGRDPNGAHHYPGFYGRVWIRYDGEPEFMRCSESFEKTLTYTGTGGGGAYDGIWSPLSTAVYKSSQGRTSTNKPVYKYPRPNCYSWDYRFFLEDFPGINKAVGDDIRAHEEQEDKHEIWAKINNQYYRRLLYTFKHQFQYEDPIIQAKDEAFLLEYRNSMLPA